VTRKGQGGFWGALQARGSRFYPATGGMRSLAVFAPLFPVKKWKRKFEKKEKVAKNGG